MGRGGTGRVGGVESEVGVGLGRMAVWGRADKRSCRSGCAAVIVVWEKVVVAVRRVPERHGVCWPAPLARAGCYIGAKCMLEACSLPSSFPKSLFQRCWWGCKWCTFPSCVI